MLFGILTQLAGMTLVGAGAGITELTALAVTSELAPTRKRGKYIAILIFTIVPFVPSGIYGQLIACKSSHRPSVSHGSPLTCRQDYKGWRYCGIIICIWNGLGFFMTLFFYFPPPRVNTLGKSKAQVLKEIDYVGGLLSIGGLVTFMAGMQWGGYQVCSISEPYTRELNVLVPMEECSRPCATNPGRRHDRGILRLGNVLCTIPNVPSTFEAGPSHPHPHLVDYIHLRSQLLLLPHVLADSIIQCLWPRSGPSWTSSLTRWTGNSGWRVYNIVVAECFPREKQGADDRRFSIDDSRYGLTKYSQARAYTDTPPGGGSLACATRDNMNTLWFLLILGGLGTGGIVVPASIITTIICPDDLIATVSALTLSIRVIGGSIGYCAYYNVFVSKFVPNAVKYIGGAMVSIGITNATYIEQAIVLTGASLIQELKNIPGIAGNDTAYEIVVRAGQIAYA